ncbi:MAG: hypothetical protein LBO66_06690 [Deltaproteobacteria bacterium]|jgi:hypothetical protein|nr:hypothetical protein [Deltaproteobacteria bacterium]
MRNVYNLLVGIFNSLRQASETLRHSRPFESIGAFWEREKKGQNAILKAEAAFARLWAEKPLEKGLTSSLLSRVAFNAVDFLARAGLAAKAKAAFRLLREMSAPEALEAKGMALLTLILIALAHQDLQEASTLMEDLCGLGDDDILLRARAEAAFFLQYGLLKEGFEEAATRLFADFSPYRERILAHPLARRGERPLSGASRLAGAPAAAGEAPERAAGDEGDGLESAASYFADFAGDVFPLALSADYQLVFAMELPANFPTVEPSEETDLIVRKMLSLYVDYFGEKGDATQALAYFRRLAEWGGDSHKDAEKLKAAVALIANLADAGEASLATSLYRESFGDAAPEGEPGGPQGEKDELKAQALINLLYVHGRAGQEKEALETYAALTKMSAVVKDGALLARATLNIISTLAVQGKLKEAEIIYNSVPDWGGSPEIKAIQGKALLSLIYYHGMSGEVERSKEFYQRLLQWGSGQELRHLRGQGALTLMGVFELWNLLKDAEELYSRVESGTGCLSQDFERARAGRSLMRIYQKFDFPLKAFEVFQGLSRGARSEQVDALQAGEAINLVTYLGEEGYPKKAREAYNLLRPWGSSPREDLLKAKAAVNLVAVYADHKEPKKARAIYESVPGADASAEVLLEKAKANVTLVGLYGGVGDARKAALVYRRFPWGQGPEFAELQESSLINLVTAQAMCSDWSAALKTATVAARDGLLRDKREELIERLNYIMSKAGGFKKKDQVNLIRLLLDRLQSPRENSLEKDERENSTFS